jgi:hypothetical protein
MPWRRFARLLPRDISSIQAFNFRFIHEFKQLDRLPVHELSASLCFV